MLLVWDEENLKRARHSQIASNFRASVSTGNSHIFCQTQFEIKSHKCLFKFPAFDCHPDPLVSKVNINRQFVL
jgi:hypothetical protein